MILNLLVEKTNDGFTSDVPTVRGCDTWADTEDEVITKTIELLRYYMKLTPEDVIKVDKVRDNFTKKQYKIIFNK
ncbi:MAG: hypothetical protein HYV28_01105 [Ignavibacteriales bacterium]|nr:hypothetical protein [Ignavibacteriales bacterium]